MGHIREVVTRKTLLMMVNGKCISCFLLRYLLRYSVLFIALFIFMKCCRNVLFIYIYIYVVYSFTYY